jgi:hypothetical protein
MLHRSAARHTFVYNIVLLYSEKRERESPVYTLQYREDIIMDPHGVWAYRHSYYRKEQGSGKLV